MTVPRHIHDKAAPKPARLGGTVEAQSTVPDLGEPPAPTAPERRLSPLSQKRQEQLEARAAAEATPLPPKPTAVGAEGGSPFGVGKTHTAYRGDAARRVTKLSAISMLRRGEDLASIINRVDHADRPAVEQAAELMKRGART